MLHVVINAVYYLVSYFLLALKVGYVYLTSLDIFKEFPTYLSLVLSCLDGIGFVDHVKYTFVLFSFTNTKFVVLPDCGNPTNMVLLKLEEPPTWNKHDKGDNPVRKTKMELQDEFYNNPEYIETVSCKSKIKRLIFRW